MQKVHGEHPTCISSELTTSQQQSADGESQEREQAHEVIKAGALVAALQQPWEVLEMGEPVNGVEERVDEIHGVWVVDQSKQGRPRTKRAKRNCARPRLGLANSYYSGCGDLSCKCDEEIETDPEMPNIVDSSDSEDEKEAQPEESDEAMPDGEDEQCKIDGQRSILDWAPGTDEQARTRNNDEDAERQGAKAKPLRMEEERKSSAQKGRWRRKLKAKSADALTGNGKPVALFEIGGQTSLNEIEQNTWQPLPRPMVVDSGAGATVMPRY